MPINYRKIVHTFLSLKKKKCSGQMHQILLINDDLLEENTLCCSCLHIITVKYWYTKVKPLSSGEK